MGVGDTIGQDGQDAKEKVFMPRQTEIRFPLDIGDVKVLKTEMNVQGDYIITVESTQTSTACRKCGREINKFYGHDKWVQLRHLPILGRRVYIRLRPKRYECPYCEDHPTTTQRLDWVITNNINALISKGHEWLAIS